MPRVNKEKWALVLSGGGARGLAHIGVLKAMEAAGFPKPSLIVGTSMGAIVGGLYACGMSSSELARFVLEEFDIGDYLDSFVFKLGGPVGQIMQAGQVIASLAKHRGADRGQKAYELFYKLTGGRNIEDTAIPFRCNALDLASGKHIIYKTGSAALAIRASMSFPAFFDPVMDNGMCLVDGGLFDNMPVSIAHDEGYRHIMAVNVSRFIPVKASDLRSGPQIIYRCMEAMLKTNRNYRKTGASLVLDVTGDDTPFSFNKKKELIEIGEYMVKSNQKAMEKFFKFRPGFFKKQIIIS